jgi:hypothetical protein
MQKDDRGALAGLPVRDRMPIDFHEAQIVVAHPDRPKVQWLIGER